VNSAIISGYCAVNIFAECGANSYQFLRADLCRRLGRIPEARASYEKALALLEPGKEQQEHERRFLRTRLEELK